MSENVKIEFEGKTYEFPIVVGSEGGKGHRYIKSSPEHRFDYPRSRIRQYRQLHEQHHLHGTVKGEFCGIAAFRLKSWPEHSSFIETALSINHRKASHKRRT